MVVELAVVEDRLVVEDDAVDDVVVLASMFDSMLVADEQAVVSVVRT